MTLQVAIAVAPATEEREQRRDAQGHQRQFHQAARKRPVGSDEQGGEDDEDQEYEEALRDDAGKHGEDEVDDHGQSPFRWGKPTGQVAQILRLMN